MLELLKKLCVLTWAAIAIYFAGWLLVHVPWPYTATIAAMFLLAWLSIRRTRQREDVQMLAADVSGLSPLAYEDYCAALLRDAGWRAHTTPLQDQGVDVLAVLRGTKAAVQCKMYSSPVGNRAVQEVVAGRLHYGAQIAVVVSTAPYTRSAYQLAESTHVLLLHHDQLPMLERLARIR